MPKAIRILVYEGSQAWLDRTLVRSIKVGYPLEPAMNVPSNKFKISELFRRTFEEGEEPEHVTTELKQIILAPNKVTFKIFEEEN